MNVLAAQRIDRDVPPAPGAPSPWGAVAQAAMLAPDICAVSARMGDGLWLAETARLQLPFSIMSAHGPAWWSAGASADAARLVLGRRDLIRDCADALRRVFAERPGWLDVIAEPADLPNLAQARKILDLWERFELAGFPDLGAFRRERAAGMVHGWIADRLFVGIEPDGRAHS